MPHSDVHLRHLLALPLVLNLSVTFCRSVFMYDWALELLW